MGVQSKESNRKSAQSKESNMMSKKSNRMGVQSKKSNIMSKKGNRGMDVQSKEK